MATCNHWICHRLVMLCFLVQQNNLGQFINEPRHFWERKKKSLFWSWKWCMSSISNAFLMLNPMGFDLGKGWGGLWADTKTFQCFCLVLPTKFKFCFDEVVRGIVCSVSFHMLCELLSRFFFFLILDQFYLFFHAFITEIFIN